MYTVECVVSPPPLTQPPDSVSTSIITVLDTGKEHPQEVHCVYASAWTDKPIVCTVFLECLVNEKPFRGWPTTLAHIHATSISVAITFCEA